MLFSIHLMLVSANFTRCNHLPMAQRTLRDQLPMHSYAQLLSKLLPSPQNGGEVWEGGSAPSPGKQKCDELFHQNIITWFGKCTSVINYS